jgi:uncharacterized protein YjiS (DUF1127 family)
LINRKQPHCLQQRWPSHAPHNDNTQNNAEKSRFRAQETYIMTTSYSFDGNTCDTVTPNSKSKGVPFFLSLASKLLRRISTFRYHLKRRNLFVALLNYNDHIIDDMGLTRSLIEEASRLPLKHNAARIARVWAQHSK